MRLEKRLRFFGLLFVQRQKIACAAALQRTFAVGSVCEEILQRGKKERTELALLPISARVDLMFDQVSEKALREVLRIVHGIPAAAHETIKGRPISLAKLSERGSRNLRVSLTSSRCKNHAPMSRSERVARAMDGLGQSFHVTRVSELRKKNKFAAISCSTASGIPL